MANTYTQIYIHMIFAVHDRKSLITESYSENLYKYICGICQNKNHLIYAIGGTKDHIHILIGMHPAESVSKLVQIIKSQSSKWMNDNYYRGDFGWQSGFAAFSYSKSFVPLVKRYIDNQKEHHRRKSFREELINILDKSGIEYNPDYIFNEVKAE